MRQRHMTQAVLLRRVNEVVGPMGFELGKVQIYQLVNGRRRATSLLMVALEELFDIPCRSWFEPV